jgi:hypothetical protein
MIVVTGRDLEINGVGEVPIGLFGVHACSLSAAQVVDWGIESIRIIHKQPSGVPMRPEQALPGTRHIVECFYDRYQPAWVLTDPQWESYLGDLGRRHGEATRASGREHLVEFWNEPYLNWSCKPGVNYDGRLYDLDGAAEGAPVRLRGEPTEHLVWKRGLLGHDAETGEVNHVLAGYAPRGLAAGDTFPIRGRTYVMREVWMAHDPTQEYYWAGRQNALWYRQMFRVFASALKETDPGVRLAGGFGFNLWNEGWACWERLIRPLIDESLPLLDAIHEHHYGGDSRLVPASYEVATAYTDARGRRLRFWNTEAGGMLDPQQPDTPKSGVEGTPLEKAIGAFTYMMRDIIHVLDVCPDKAQTRAAHHAEHNGGDEFAFRLLKPLRGRLIEVRGADHERWCVASRHGTTLCVVCFNDGRTETRIPLLVDAPSGTGLAGTRLLGVRPRDDGLGLQMTDEAIAASGSTWTGEVTVPPKAARTLVFQLSGIPSAVPVTRVSQHFAHDILATVPPRGSLTLRIAMPVERLARARGARLKLVCADQDSGCRLTVNGVSQPMPPAGTWTTRQGIDPAILAADTLVEFTAGEHPLRVLMTSIELIEDA